MKRIAVLDTSLISTWLKIQRQFDLFVLLPNIAEYALVPQKVVEEIARHSPEGERPEGRQRFLDSITDAHGFYRLCTTIDAVFLYETSTLPKVDPGEAEATALAVEIKADRILIDESMGRQKATELTLKTVGVLGVLLRAKQDGYITEVKPLLDRLVNEADFYVHKKLYLENLLESQPSSLYRV